jgi:hypothetical protein
MSIIESLPAMANNDAWLVHRGRYLDTTFLLGVGDKSYLARIHRGRVDAFDRVGAVMPRFTFSLKASQEAWAMFWRPVPPPGSHDLMAMIKSKALVLEGDQHPFFANLRYFKDLLALPRVASASAGGTR